MSKSGRSTLAAVAIAFALCPGVDAFAALSLVGGSDIFLDGSFELAYGDGDGSGTAFVTPYLFASGSGNAATASGYAGGAQLGYSYSYSFAGAAPSVFEVDYTITNNRNATDPIPNATDLRLLIDVLAYGSAAAITTDIPSSQWDPARPGDPSARQIQDANVDTFGAILPATNALSNGADNCAAAGCTTDLGLEWDLPLLGPGQSWNVKLLLVDDPALVSGGRYLRADSVDVPGNVLIAGAPVLSAVPEPDPWSLLAVGTLSLGLLRRRIARECA